MDVDHGGFYIAITKQLLDRTDVASAGAAGPHLAGRQRIAVNGVVAVELRGGHELLDSIEAEGVAEVGVAELALEVTEYGECLSISSLPL